MNLQEKQRAIQELNDQLAHDDTLSLKVGSTHDVPGEGNPDSEVLFIGEAPGKREDELGRPFVGAAGKLLDELISSIGLKREDVFIANLIKHRPPENRDPTPEEIRLYAPYLEKQIEIIQPKIIVTLGRHSMRYFLSNTASITVMHGKAVRNKRGQIIMAMYHPAAALYSASLKPVLEADFAKIPRVLEKAKEDIPSEHSSLQQPLL